MWKCFKQRNNFEKYEKLWKIWNNYERIWTHWKCLTKYEQLRTLKKLKIWKYDKYLHFYWSKTRQDAPKTRVWQIFGRFKEDLVQNLFNAESSTIQHRTRVGKRRIQHRTRQKARIQPVRLESNPGSARRPESSPRWERRVSHKPYSKLCWGYERGVSYKPYSKSCWGHQRDVYYKPYSKSEWRQKGVCLTNPIVNHAEDMSGVCITNPVVNHAEDMIGVWEECVLQTL